jgi:hypothetical protein
MIENDGDMLSYNPYQYRCCQHNVAFAWPYFAEHLFMATPGDGLAAVLYAPSTVRAKVGTGGQQIEIEEQTNYPFSDEISFQLRTNQDVQFPLALRVPGWSGRPSLMLNGDSLLIQHVRKRWLIVDRLWHNGDQLTLSLPMHITATVWTKNKGSVSVNRGPLTYSLKIAERWQRYGDQDWPAYEVYPASAWNYGLIIDPNRPDATIQVARVSRDLPSQPFAPEEAPIDLRAKGKRVSNWMQERNGLVGLLPGSPVTEGSSEEEITLIPMGCARLRISAFPQVH